MSAPAAVHNADTGTIRLHHGTDLASANFLMLNGVDQQRAAVSNSSGEFWATTDHDDAEWFARSNPRSPPAACFEFELEAWVVQALLQMQPPGVIFDPPSIYEFLPAGYGLLNATQFNQKVVLVP